MHVQSYTIPKFPQKTNCEKTRRTKHQKPPEPFQTETLRGMQTRQRLFTSLLGHGAAHTVLKIPRIAFVQHSLVEYCESKLVSFGRCGISRKRYHSFKRAGLACTLYCAAVPRIRRSSVPSTPATGSAG